MFLIPRNEKSPVVWGEIDSALLRMSLDERRGNGLAFTTRSLVS